MYTYTSSIIIVGCVTDASSISVKSSRVRRSTTSAALAFSSALLASLVPGIGKTSAPYVLEKPHQHTSKASCAGVQPFQSAMEKNVVGKFVSKFISWRLGSVLCQSVVSMSSTEVKVLDSNPRPSGL